MTQVRWVSRVLGSRHRPLLLMPVVLLAVLILVLPHSRNQEGIKLPAHATVVAAIQTGQVKTITGRIVKIQPSGLLVRVLLGEKRVATLRSTHYTNTQGAAFAHKQLRRGDRVQVWGYSAGSILLAIAVQDTSRQ